jgi:hypothetical protein
LRFENCIDDTLLFADVHLTAGSRQVEGQNDGGHEISVCGKGEKGSLLTVPRQQVTHGKGEFLSKIGIAPPGHPACWGQSEEGWIVVVAALKGSDVVIHAVHHQSEGLSRGASKSERGCREG